MSRPGQSTRSSSEHLLKLCTGALLCSLVSMPTLASATLKFRAPLKAVQVNVINPHRVEATVTMTSPSTKAVPFFRARYKFVSKSGTKKTGIKPGSWFIVGFQRSSGQPDQFSVELAGSDSLYDHGKVQRMLHIIPFAVLPDGSRVRSRSIQVPH